MSHLFMNAVTSIKEEVTKFVGDAISAKTRYHISSKVSAPPIFRHLVAEMRTKLPNFGKRFGTSS